MTRTGGETREQKGRDAVRVWKHSDLHHSALTFEEKNS